MFAIPKRKSRRRAGAIKKQRRTFLMSLGIRFWKTRFLKPPRPMPAEGLRA